MMLAAAVAVSRVALAAASGFWNHMEIRWEVALQPLLIGKHCNIPNADCFAWLVLYPGSAHIKFSLQIA